MRNVTGAQVRAYRDDPLLDQEGLGLRQIADAMQRHYALEACRDAKTLAELAEVVDWLIRQSGPFIVPGP